VSDELGDALVENGALLVIAGIDVQHYLRCEDATERALLERIGQKALHHRQKLMEDQAKLIANEVGRLFRG